MSRIAKAFAGKKAFISFLTAGDPDIETTEKNILALVAGGSSLIEIGIPFSDPIAEGPVIERANMRALACGTTLETVFELVRRLREKTDVALVFLTYINPIFVYGAERFFKKAAEAGVDGCVIPDLPFEERGELMSAAKAYQIELISLIAPTSLARVELIAKEATGFIYLVSSMGVTGVRQNFSDNLMAIIKKIREVTKTPIAIGFGIATVEQVRELKSYADGIIIGSAIVKQIEMAGVEAPAKLEAYATEIVAALK
ncbi:tryptophan synthase alpha chain [Erysipelotrichaceae bacterium]|nr:tryptophan synthase alpha chain [Erysipelotrichaceae bacterium]